MNRPASSILNPAYRYIPASSHSGADGLAAFAKRQAERKERAQNVKPIRRQANG